MAKKILVRQHHTVSREPDTAQCTGSNEVVTGRAVGEIIRCTECGRNAVVVPAAEYESPHQRAAKLLKAQLVDMVVKERSSVYGNATPAKTRRRFYESLSKASLVMLVVSEGLVQ